MNTLKENSFQKLPLSEEENGRKKLKLDDNSTVSKDDPMYETLVNEKVTELKAENDKLLAVKANLIEKLKKKSLEASYGKGRLTLNAIIRSTSSLTYYTGCKDKAFINYLIEDLKSSDNYKHENNFDLKIEEQVFLVLMLLRRNYSMLDLAFRFRIDVQQAKAIATSVIDALHNIHYCKTLEGTPFPPAPPKESVHEEFKNLPDCRIILVKCQMECRLEDGITKVMHRCFVGVSPSKRIIYISKLFSEEDTFREMVLGSDVLDYTRSGDVLIAEEGHNIADVLPEGVYINCSPFLDDKIKDDKLYAIEFAKARFLIKRSTMNYIKKYFILNSLPEFLNSRKTQIWQLCASLVNCDPFLTCTSIYTT